MKELATFLRLAGLSQATFGRRIGTSGAVVCRWLSGKRVPSTEFALAVERETKGAVPVEVWDRRRAHRRAVHGRVDAARRSA